MSSHHTKKPSQSQSAPPVVSGTFPVWKGRGETLATLLGRFRRTSGLGVDTKLTYAGRLDPMAEGLVLVLAGESRFEKDALLGLSKVYEIEVLLGIATDTLDPLGLISDTSYEAVDTAQIKRAVETMRSVTSLPYPMYSSVPVQGKPLFVHARAGTLVEVPRKKIRIKAAEILSTKKESIATIARDAIVDIEKVQGDFRQEEIIKNWKPLLTDAHEVTLVTIRIEASSGTYMRSLAEWMGQQLGVPAMAYRIKRLSLGDFMLPGNE